VYCHHHDGTKWVLKEKKGVFHLERCNTLQRSKLDEGGKDNKPIAFASAIVQDTPAKQTEHGAPPPNQGMMAECLATLIKLADDESDTNE